ncbi:hypothetical protein PI124_g1854 [Phytophthora idaei]|nr:hypothetical protein PI125_g1577 [Phytophthora idaei]KAG3173278.1 hypothetical protein PI126_g927 [Phytophthora idaei]KAG3253578.1 hypothetical protein PI124_g1854 [Phytophthora idaei]
MQSRLPDDAPPMATTPQPTSGSEAGANPAQGELATRDRSEDDVGAALHEGQVSPTEDSEWCADARSDSRSSEERDKSDDSDFSLESDSGGIGEEELTADSGLDEDESMEDISNFYSQHSNDRGYRIGHV